MKKYSEHNVVSVESSPFYLCVGELTVIMWASHLHVWASLLVGKFTGYLQYKRLKFFSAVKKPF